VYRAVTGNPITGQAVAVKQIELKGFREEEIVQLMKEVDLVKKLSHPNIIKYETIDRSENTLSIMLECVFIHPAPLPFN
jgi:serine/threonine protein kinase